MKPLQNHETENYSLEIRGRLAVLNLKNDAFELSTSLDVKRNYMGLLEAVDASPDLHALLIRYGAKESGIGRLDSTFESAPEIQLPANVEPDLVTDETLTVVRHLTAVIPVVDVGGRTGTLL